MVPNILATKSGGRTHDTSIIWDIFEIQYFKSYQISTESESSQVYHGNLIKMWILIQNLGVYPRPTHSTEQLQTEADATILLLVLTNMSQLLTRCS